MPDDELNVGLLLFMPYRAMENRVLAAVADAGFADFTTAQARIAARIGPDGTRLTELAQQAQVTKQTAAVLVSALERGGYVERVPDPTDRRARLIRLAERGHAAAAVANAAVAEVEAEWVEYLGTKSMTELKRILTRLRVVTDPYR